MNYDHKTIELKWQKEWEKRRRFAASDEVGKPKYYALVEFPYPSGEGLHVGHPRSYTAIDILARKRRMQGYNVLYPMGFDAFGLPSENYAIKTGIHPAITTKKNIETFTKQLSSLGLSFDWSRAVSTADPEYYKWTQWIFLQLYKHGLAYKDSIPINWCPACKIGLANEEVVNGSCERCGTVVEKRQKEQWMLRITKYADRLLEDLESVDYLERIKTQQRNWIGRSEGAEVNFAIRLGGKELTKDILTVYTTRPDTLFGVSFMVLSPEHPMIESYKSRIANWDEIASYRTEATKKTEIDRTDATKAKTGVRLEGLSAINPINNRAVPIFVADYVLMDYGTGAIMAVPAHDQRDWEFAQSFQLQIPLVIGPKSKTDPQPNLEHEPYANKAGVLVNSGSFTGLSPAQGQVEITNWLEEHGHGKLAVQYKLRDWVFSRQRYWGEPIPMILCQKCGWAPVPEKELPVVLPEVEKYEPTDSGDSPLAAMTDWVNVRCPKCKGAARRETDTMPNWAGSNWYFLRYLDPRNKKELAGQDVMRYWLPIDWYNGGMEHTTLHLLYSRFIYKFLYDIGVVPKQAGSEPYAKRTSHGLVLGENGEKMSKSRGNVVNPNDIVAKFGADTLRVYEMFMGPFDQMIPWDTNGVIGVRRFLDRVWQLYQHQLQGENDSTAADDKQREVESLLHRTVEKVSADIETQDYNTAVSAMMIFINAAFETKNLRYDLAEIFLRLLSPFAPHLAEELWRQMGHRESISEQVWPEADPELARQEQVSLAVQIDGKLRGVVTVPTNATAERVEAVARQLEGVSKHLEGHSIKNVIFVPNRLINFVRN